MIAVALFLLAGLGWSRRLDPEASLPTWLAEAVLLGGGAGAGALVVLDVLRIPWSPGSLVLATAALAGVAWWPVPRTTRPKASSLGDMSRRPHDLLLSVPLTVITVVLAVYRALTPVQWSPVHYLINRRDFFFIWGYKANLFFIERAIPWRFLAGLPNDFSHPDYPLLVPLLFDVQSVLSGSWRPEAFVVIDAALGGALLVLVHRCMRDEFGPVFSAAGALALSACALLPWPGFADGPFVAYSASAALLLRRAIRRPSAPAALAGVLLALAAMCKNEGIAFSLATALALALVNRRLLPRLWPAALAIVAWAATRFALGLHTDLFAAGILGRFVHNVQRFPHAFANIPAYQSWAWIGALLGLALAPVENVRRERFLLTIVVLQLAFYLGAYAVSPLDVVGHVNGSWDRISSHVTMLLAFAGVTSIGESLRR